MKQRWELEKIKGSQSKSKLQVLLPLCYAMLCYAMLCYAMLCYAMLWCYAMLCYAMLCYAMLCYAMLCYAMLYSVCVVATCPAFDSWFANAKRANSNNYFLVFETTNDWCTFLACKFVLRFYGPVNSMGSCRARSVYLTTRLLGRLSPLSG